MSIGKDNTSGSQNKNYQFQYALLKQLIDLNTVTSGSTTDGVVLGQEEMTLSNTAQPLPFTNVNSADVKAVEFRVRKVGAPADSTYIATFTMKAGDTPTTTHGQYVGNGDLYTVTNNTNITAFKIIATENLAHVMHIVYYG